MKEWKWPVYQEQLQQQHQQKQHVLEPVRLMDSAGDAGVAGTTATAEVEFSLPAAAPPPPMLGRRPLSPPAPSSNSGVPTPAPPHTLV